MSPVATGARGRLLRMAAAAAIVPLVAGCALPGGLFGTVGPDYATPAPPAARWHAAPPAAHGGSAAALARWWAQFDDAALVALIDAAQRDSASLADAAARIARARADAVAAGAAGNPSLDATAGANRSAFSFGGPAVMRTQASVGLQSSWEIDLFGGLARQREAARAQLEAARAQWHDARVALAAEVANAYANHRLCELQVELARADGASREETARLTGIAADAGLQSSAAAALARASAADAAATLAQRRAECEIGIKGLVALTGLDEPALRAVLARAAGSAPALPKPARFAIDALPATVLAQRPDVAAAERELAAASAEIGVAEAERYPRLTLAGNVTPTRSRLDGSPTISVTTWSIGPALVLPLADGGRRAANVDAARARYTAAAAQYRARARQAVREVEEALVRLASVDTRDADTRRAAAGYRAGLAAAQTRQRAGLASVAEVEDARRTALAAEAALVALEYEGLSAWIALYRAAGGGWERDAAASAMVLPEGQKQ
ncbi:MAG: efflux transporter outer membrane subunit [Burkholderiales bacterium]|nr:efflux transporter outer membrane subunit [Burkholderiales bacterium]